MLHKIFLVLVIAFLVFLLMLVFSLCRISGHCSRQEEAEEQQYLANQGGCPGDTCAIKEIGK